MHQGWGDPSLLLAALIKFGLWPAPEWTLQQFFFFFFFFFVSKKRGATSTLWHFLIAASFCTFLLSLLLRFCCMNSFHVTTWIICALWMSCHVLKSLISLLFPCYCDFTSLRVCLTGINTKRMNVVTPLVHGVYVDSNCVVCGGPECMHAFLYCPSFQPRKPNRMQ